MRPPAAAAAESAGFNALWFQGLWCAFPTTLWRSLAFVGRRPWIAALAGALAMRPMPPLQVRPC